MRSNNHICPHILDDYTVEVLITLALITGGLSVALTVPLPASPVRDALLIVTNILVLFSIIVQGLTIGTLVKFAKRRE